MTCDSELRPELTPELSNEEFQRWYWLKEELADFARTLGIRATGSKDLLAARIMAALGGRNFVEPAPVRRVGAAQLSGELTPSTIIPVGQRSSQIVRAWMTVQVGPAFHFDAEMRDFFTQSDGTKTLQDAVEHWHATRDQGPRTIGSQFEYNRFTRAWFEKNPDATRDEVIAAWKVYRRSPVDERGRA